MPKPEAIHCGDRRSHTNGYAATADDNADGCAVQLLPSPRDHARDGDRGCVCVCGFSPRGCVAESLHLASATTG